MGGLDAQYGHYRNNEGPLLPLLRGTEAANQDGLRRAEPTNQDGLRGAEAANQDGLRSAEPANRDGLCGAAGPHCVGAHQIHAIS